MVIVGTFLTLWVTQFGIEQGMNTAAASGRAFMLFGLVQVSALIWAGIMGILADRLNRMTSLCIALVLAAVGYSMMGQLRDPLAPAAIPFAVMLGIAEVSLIVAGGALLGQEARESLRGAVVGVFNLSRRRGYCDCQLGGRLSYSIRGSLNALRHHGRRQRGIAGGGLVGPHAARRTRAGSGRRYAIATPGRLAHCIARKLTTRDATKSTIEIPA